MYIFLFNSPVFKSSANYYVFQFRGEDNESQAGELISLEWQIVTVTLLTSSTRPCIDSLVLSIPALTVLTHIVFGQWNNSKHGTHTGWTGACAMLFSFLPAGNLCDTRCSLDRPPRGWAEASALWMRSASLYQLKQDSQGVEPARKPSESWINNQLLS